jgi:hypothetical protein
MAAFVSVSPPRPSVRAMPRSYVSASRSNENDMANAQRTCPTLL